MVAAARKTQVNAALDTRRQPDPEDFRVHATELPSAIDTTLPWIEPALWLGIGVGLLMIATGCVGAALSRWQSENTYVAANYEFLLLWGSVLGLGCGVLSAVAFVLVR